MKNCPRVWRYFCRKEYPDEKQSDCLHRLNNSQFKKTVRPYDPTFFKGERRMFKIEPLKFYIPDEECWRAKRIDSRKEVRP